MITKLNGICQGEMKML